jgi:hypothetical protein
MKILDKYETSELKTMLNESRSFREFLLKIKSSSNGSGSYKSIKTQIINKGIKIPDFNYSNKKLSTRLSNDDIFIKNSNYSRQHLKERIIKEKLIEYVCDKCKNDGNWQGLKLSLQLEHKNGINNDNRLENLCFLCPNCHSQTDTYSGKSLRKGKQREKRFKLCSCGKKMMIHSNKCVDCNNKEQRKVERPTYEQLVKEVEDLGYCGTGRKYGVSDNSIRKWIKIKKNIKDE